MTDELQTKQMVDSITITVNHPCITGPYK